MQHLTFFKKFAAVLTLGLFLSVSFAVFGQTPKVDEALELKPAQTLQRQMTGAETHRYKLSLTANEFFQVRVEQKGVDVALKLVDAKGNTLATMDSPNEREGPETLSFVAAGKGSYTLEVSGFDATATKGDYTIRREGSRIATPQDRRRVEVEKLFVEGMTALATKGQSETAMTRLSEALRGWQELRDDALLELTAQQIKRLRASQKERAYSILGEGNALVKRNTKESLHAALLKYEGARRLYQDVGDNAWESFCLIEAGTVYLHLGENEKAAESYNLAWSLIKDSRDKVEEIRTLFRIGKSYLDLGHHQKAIEYYNLGLLLVKERGNKRGEAETLTFISKIYLDSGDNQEALEDYNNALTIYKNLGDKVFEATTLNTIGSIYYRLDERQKALEYYKQALLVFEGAGDKNGEADILTNIGEIYSGLGEKQKALEYFKRSLQISGAAGTKFTEARARVEIGTVYSNLGEKQKALEYFNLALPVFKEAKDKSYEARTLLNIGRVNADLGEQRKALGSYGQASALYKEVGDQLSQAYALLGIGTAYLDLGDKQKAIEYYNFALPLFRLAGNRFGEAGVLNNLGTLYRDLGEHQKSLEYFSLALPLSRAIGDRRGEAVTLDNLGYAWQLLGSPRLAILYGKQAVNLLQSLRADIKGLDKELQQSFLGAVEDTYRRLVELLVKEKRIPEAERILRMLKEEEYFEFVSRDGRVVASLDERINLNPTEKQAAEQYETTSLEINQIYRKIAAIEQEKSTASTGQTRNISERQTQLNNQLEVSSAKLNSFLVELSNDFAKGDTDSKSVEESSQAIVKEWKDPQTAVVSTIVGVKHLSLILTTAGFQRGYLIDVSEDKLNKLVGDFRTAIIEESDPQPAAQKLYDVLVKPLEQDLDVLHAHTLIWSLDKFLRYVPVAALWDKDRGYLVQNYASVVLALASRQDLAFRPAGKNQWQALGVGVSTGAEGFSPLSSVPEELQAIVRDSSAQPKRRESGMIAGRRLLDEQFTYNNFLKSLGNYRFTHAATHFKFITGTKAEGLNSFLLLGNGEKLTLQQVQDSDNIFAGIELLTLSACDTGYGGKTADGREIEGLGVLAQRKGARAIMATLWPVDSESTRDFMIEFYGTYQKPNFNKAEALRQAQLALLQEPDRTTVGKPTKPAHASSKGFAHPYYWSPFILIGNWQ